MRFRISRFIWSVLLLLFASALVLFSLTLPDISRGALIMEILALWVLIVLTVRTYLQETAPKANLENITKAGWTMNPNSDPEDPYLVFTRGRESLVVHAKDWDFVNYRLEDGKYWANEDIRGDVYAMILAVPMDLEPKRILSDLNADTHTHKGATPFRARLASILSPIKAPQVKTVSLDTHSHTHGGATPPPGETEADRKRREWRNR